MSWWSFWKAVVSASGVRPEVTVGQQYRPSGCEVGMSEDKLVPERANWKSQVQTRSHICLSLSPILRWRWPEETVPPLPWSCTAAWPRPLWNWKGTWGKSCKASWPHTNKLGKWISKNAHKLHQCLVPSTDLQHRVAAASLMPSKTHTNFSLGNPNLEPYRTVNSGKCYFRLAELTQYKTILPGNAYMRWNLCLPLTWDLLCSRALQITPPS